MSRFNWGKSKASPRKEPRRVRLELEALEDRMVLSATTSYTVAAGDVATLIADINAANANGASTPTTINLTAGTYDFTAANNNTFGPNALPVITGDITINGNGAVLERDPSLGENTPFRFFYVSGSTVANPSSSSQSTGQTTGTLALNNLTLQGGLAQGGQSDTGGGGLGGGGAIFNMGNLTLNGVTVTQNLAEGGSGGTGTAGGGGGMGQGGQGDNGGGFGGSSTTTTTSGTLGVGGTGSSSASGGSGAIGGGGGDSTIASTSDASYSGGTGGFGGGGGSGVSYGGAGGFGGGGGAGNTTAGTGGFGAGSGNGSAGGGGLGAGGAIFNMYGTTTLINSTLASNLAEGGQGGNAGDGYGGAIFNLDGTLSITTSTIADNSAVNGGGAVYNLALGTTAATSTTAAAGVPSTVTLTDSILADSIGSNDLVNDQNNSTAGAAVVNATAPNIVMNLSTLDGATTNGTPNSANPQLGLLFNYGGPTATMPLLAGSPALGTGTAGTNVPTVDQRGATRGNVVDLGAVQQTPPEAAATTLALTSTTPASSGSSVTLTATVAATSGSTTPAGTVQFVDSTTGATLGSSALSVVNGQAQATLTTSSVSSGDKITATYTSSNSLGGSSANTSVSAASTSTTSTSTSTNSTQMGLWLNAVYEALLHRPIDPSGLTYWTGALNGGASPTQVVQDIEGTIEYQTDEIQAAYQNLMGTSAPSSAVSYLVGLMQSGTSFQTVESLIVGSNAFYVASGDTTQSFLNAVYEDFLGRPVDATGQAQWGALLAAGYSTTQVAQGILSTQEYLTDLVEQDYLTYMNRQADPTSLSAYVTALGSGTMTNDMVVASLLGSGEYVSQVTASSTTST